jgi:hypothetical protein
MSVSLLGGDITVYFTNDTGGDKQIRWTGSTANTATRTVNELYSALMDLFDNVTAGAGDYMNEGIPMKAITPTQYDIGLIETNDNEPWFIDNFTTEHLTGGTIETLGWTRTPGSTIGIVKVQCSSTGFNLTTSDIGDAITHGDGDAGTILDVDTTNFVVYIRPNSSDAANNFDSTSGTLTATTSTNTATQTAASTTGNSTWANVFTVGTIQGDEQIYVAQDETVLTPWWPVGQFNRLFRIRENSTFIDNGYLTVYIRRVNRLYDNFLVDASGGGANVAPVNSNFDLNNETVGAIAAAGITIGFSGPYTADVNDDATNETYSIQINAAGNTVEYVYEYLKYITRYTSTTDLNGVEGQQYIGIDFKIDYATETGTVNIGDTVTGSTSGATGIVVNKTATYVTLMNSEGTFVNGENLTVGANSLNTTSSVTGVAPTKTAPFGTFAGGRFFGAFGVLLTNVAGTDVNNYQLIADDGVTYAEPIQVSFTITAIQPGTEIRIFTDPSLVQVAGKEDVGGGGAPEGDQGLVQAGPDADGLYTVSYSYIYSTLATNFPDDQVGGDLPIFVVAHNVNYQWLRLSATLTEQNGSLQLSQISDRQYI